MKQLSKLVLALFIGLAPMAGLHAQNALGTAQGANAPAAMADGEIRKIDKSAGKITIKHGHLPRLDMAPMTMVFRVGDPALLEQVKVGDRVRFDADKVNGALTVVKIEAEK